MLNMADTEKFWDMGYECQLTFSMNFTRLQGIISQKVDLFSHHYENHKSNMMYSFQ
jgi:hypothetical protein